MIHTTRTDHTREMRTTRPDKDAATVTVHRPRARPTTDTAPPAPVDRRHAVPDTAQTPRNPADVVTAPADSFTARPTLGCNGRVTDAGAAIDVRHPWPARTIVTRHDETASAHVALPADVAVTAHTPVPDRATSVAGADAAESAHAPDVARLTGNPDVVAAPIAALPP